MTFQEKLSKLNKVDFRHGDEAAEIGFGILKDKPEHELTTPQRKQIDSYFYRYRRQIFPKDNKLCKLDFGPFYIELSNRQPKESEKSVKADYIRNNTQGQFKEYQTKLF